MTLAEEDSYLRKFETYHDFCVPSGLPLIARLDGRGFSKLTEELKYKKPFDDTFKDIMSHIVISIMRESGIHIVYGYTQSDEISLLLAHDEDTFNRKTRKLNSVLASYASAFFAERQRVIAPFDCRISTPTSIQDVIRYFLWRQEDAARNALLGYSYWMLRHSGISARRATSRLHGATVPDKHELLFKEFGINFTKDVPVWQKRGLGVYWEEYTKTGRNPITDQKVDTTRRRLVIDENLPMKEDYGKYIENLYQ